MKECPTNLHGDNELTSNQRKAYKRIALFVNEKELEWSVEMQEDWTAEPGRTWTDLSFESDELLLHFGDKKAAVLFTEEGMKTICPKCGGDIEYTDIEFTNKPGAMKTVWHCKDCGHPFKNGVNGGDRK